MTSMILGQSSGIKGISVLTANEWSGTRHADSASGFETGDNYMLSLRPGDKWDEGTAYLVLSRYSYSPRRGREPAQERVWMETYKGVFHLYASEKDKDVLVIRTGFTKRYHGTFLDGGAQTKWAADQAYRPQGADLILSLDDNRTVPRDKLELSVERGYFVDDDGDETVVRWEPSTLREKLTGRGEVRTVSALPFAEIGETLLFVKGDIFPARDGLRMAPGYRPRPSQIPLTQQKVQDALYP